MLCYCVKQWTVVVPPLSANSTMLVICYTRRAHQYSHSGTTQPSNPARHGTLVSASSSSSVGCLVVTAGCRTMSFSDVMLLLKEQVGNRIVTTVVTVCRSLHGRLCCTHKAFTANARWNIFRWNHMYMSMMYQCGSLTRCMNWTNSRMWIIKWICIGVVCRNGRSLACCVAFGRWLVWSDVSLDCYLPIEIDNILFNNKWIISQNSITPHLTLHHGVGYEWNWDLNLIRSLVFEFFNTFLNSYWASTEVSRPSNWYFTSVSSQQFEWIVTQFSHSQSPRPSLDRQPSLPSHQWSLTVQL